MNYLTYTRHYSVSRGEAVKRVYSYFSANYPSPPQYQYFEFVNDTKDYGENWGQSKQMSQALSGSDFFKVLYASPSYMVYYQDTEAERPTLYGLSEIKISTKQFLNP